MEAKQECLCRLCEHNPREVYSYCRECWSGDSLAAEMLNPPSVIKLVLRHDEDAESPRQWSNVGTMACWHRRYNLGDEQPGGEPMEWLRELAADHVGADDPDAISDEHVERIIAKHFVMLPLFLYDHSGLAMNCGGFSCPWDSGQVGWIYCTKAKAIEECTSVEKAEEYLRGEVETYSQWLGGDVWGFEVREYECDEDGEETDEYEVLDSCWGFYGSDPKKNGMAEHLSAPELAGMVEFA